VATTGILQQPRMTGDGDFLGPIPVGLVTVFYCLRFETSLFVASYDSLGFGGGIRPRLHTGLLVSYITTDGQSASLPWCQAPFWGLCPDILLLRSPLSAPADIYVSVPTYCFLLRQQIFKVSENQWVFVGYCPVSLDSFVGGI
jgi:hypothetical protein